MSSLQLEVAVLRRGQGDYRLRVFTRYRGHVVETLRPRKDIRYQTREEAHIHQLLLALVIAGEDIAAMEDALEPDTDSDKPAVPREDDPAD